MDWLNFLVADVQTGFGPFIAVYLTVHRWTQGEIGAALSLGALAAMASQIPAGWLVDVLPSKSRAAALAILALTASALGFALWPTTLPVLAAELLHGFASCMLTPAIAAISLALVGQAGIAERLGRNGRWASVGSGVAAALMGACGYYVSTRAVFLLTAALCVPAVATLAWIRAPERPPRRAVPPRRLLLDRRLLALAGCAALFQLANAGMLPLLGGALTRQRGAAASALIAACIVVPQLVVAALSPWVGRAADCRGRRALLLLGFASVPLRGLLFAALPAPLLAVAVQTLDGIGGATFGVLVPLICADIAGGSGRFNLAMGTVGLAVNIGACLSTSLAGQIADRGGESLAFLALAAAGTAGLLLVWLVMPETSQTGVQSDQPIRWPVTPAG